jgi:hypothetical protein
MSATSLERPFNMNIPGCPSIQILELALLTLQSLDKLGLENGWKDDVLHLEG